MSSTGIATTDARLLVEAALQAGGLPVMPHAGQLQASPGVMVAAGNPWLVPIPSLRMLARMSRWRVICVAGMVDVEGILDQLGTMLAQAAIALREAGIPTDRTEVPGPGRLPYDNAVYLTTELIALVPVDLATLPTPTQAHTDPEE